MVVLGGVLFLMSEVPMYQVAKLGDATGKLLKKRAGPEGKAASLQDLKKHLLDSMSANRTAVPDVILPSPNSESETEDPHAQSPNLDPKTRLFGFRLMDCSHDCSDSA